jgi:uncharacterized protein YihD (DUF1040 family)
MNILSLSRNEVVAFVESGFMKDADLKHYDICKELAAGKTQEKIAEQFNLTDDSYVRKIKKRKCPDCYR